MWTLIALVVFFGPIILSIIALSRASGTHTVLKGLNDRIAALTERVARLEQAGAVPSAGEGLESKVVLKRDELAEEPLAAEREEVSASLAEPIAPALPEEIIPEALEEQYPPGLPPPELETPSRPSLEPAGAAVQAAIPAEAIEGPGEMPAVRHAAPAIALEHAAARARSLEERITANWLVWIGGIAVALGGIFLVRYAAEQGWLSPALRCIAGVILGAIFVAAGEAIRRRPLEQAIAAVRPDYVPQALTAAGLFTAFASVYLAYAFYDLLSASITFTLLAAIALAGFLLALLQGPFVAALGLVGAMATPALVSTDNPTAWGLFSYLAVIAAAAMAVADRRRWWWLVLGAIAASFTWSMIWLVKMLAVDYTVVAMASMAGIEAVGAVFLSRRDYRRGASRDIFGFVAEQVAWVGLGTAIVTIFLLALRTEFTAAAHWAMFALALGASAVVRFNPRFELALPVVCVAVLAAFGFVYLDGIALENLAERALGWPPATAYAYDQLDAFAIHASLVSLVLFAGGVVCLGRSWRRDPVALATAAVPLLLLCLGYAEFRHITGDQIWAGPAVLLLAASWLAAGVVGHAGRPMPFVEGVYVTVAVASAVLALTFLFDRVWLTIAYALLVVAMGVVSLRADSAILRRLASLVAMLVVLRLTVNPDLRGYEIFHWLGMQWVTYGYLLPMAAFIVAARLFRQSRDDLMVTVLEGGALLFAILFVSIEIRILMTGTIYSGSYKLPEMSLQTIAWLTSALVLSYRQTKYPRPFSLWGARILTLAGTLQALVLQLVMFNPAFTGEAIQGYGLFNLLILSLLAPAVLLWAIGSYAEAIAPRSFQRASDAAIGLRAASSLLAFAFITEEVRVLFQGMVITPRHATLLELYITTLVWLTPAVLPFAFGGLKRFRAVEIVALAVIAASAMMLAAGHGWFFNPAFTGEEIRGWPVLNTLLLGFFVPAGVLAWLSRRVDPWLRPIAVALCYLLLFVGVWLMVKQGFEGAQLRPQHTSLLELYTTTMLWLGLAALPLTSRRVGAIEGATEAGLAVLAVSLLMLFAGHAFAFNPVFDGSIVYGWPLLNTLLLGFIAPSLVIAWIARSMASRITPWLSAAAYVLLFVGITLLVKHAFQGGYMVPETLTDAESYTYSAAWIALAVLTMVAGIGWNRPEMRYAALAVLVLAVLKVFLLDMSGLGGLWRVASFLGLGLSLIGIGWIYQRFVHRQRDKPAPMEGAERGA